MFPSSSCWGELRPNLSFATAGPLITLCLLVRHGHRWCERRSSEPSVTRGLFTRREPHPVPSPSCADHARPRNESGPCPAGYPTRLITLFYDESICCPSLHTLSTQLFCPFYRSCGVLTRSRTTGRKRWTPHNRSSCPGSPLTSVSSRPFQR